MIKFKKHAPGYCAMGDDFYTEIEFKSTNELLNDEFVKKFKADGDYCIYKNYLMVCDYEEPFWWVIGYITDGLNEVDLPKWDIKRAEGTRNK